MCPALSLTVADCTHGVTAPLTYPMEGGRERKGEVEKRRASRGGGEAGGKSTEELPPAVRTRSVRRDGSLIRQWALKVAVTAW